MHACMYMQHACIRTYVHTYIQIARLAAQRDRLEARRDKLKDHMDRNGGVLSLPPPDSPRVKSRLLSRLESSHV